MQKFISQKQLYSSIKQVSDDVQSGTVFIVLKHSKPAYKITPLNTEENPEEKIKQNDTDDYEKYIFYPKTKTKLSDTELKKILAPNIINTGKKKYTKHDILQFNFESKNDEADLATNYKKYLY